ncbi:MAG: coproporphyrinogen III oxidase, partial [Phycisphaerae bacterium]
YVETLQQDKLPIRRAMEVTPRQRMIREWVLQMKLGRVEFSYFRDKFGLDPREEFKSEIQVVERDGLAQMDDNGVSLTRAGLLRVDAILHSFFEAQFRKQEAA